MLQDTYRLPVTTDSQVAIESIHWLTQQALSYSNQVQFSLFRGHAADRECALIHAYTAAYYLTQEEARFRQQAMHHLRLAQQQLDKVTDREQWTIQAIAAWAAGKIQQAIALHRQIIEHYPQDLLAVQQAQYHYFYQGDTQQLLQVAEQVLPANPDNHYLYGMVAFGLEQCHRLSEAEEMAHRAIAINQNDPWAHHAIAHVLETQGRIDEGIRWMEQHADTWEHCNSMLYTHNWWHIALFYLAKGAFQTVLQLYDRHVWGRARKDSPKDQVGAIATLTRLELQGVDVGARWQELSHYLRPRLHEHFLPFQDLHYVYAFARSGQPESAAEMLHSMRLHAQRLHPGLRKTWVEVAIPLAAGLAAYATGQWAEAIAQFDSALPRIHQVGGSHTQRNMFHQLYQAALRQEHEQPVVISFFPRSPKRGQQTNQKPNQPPIAANLEGARTVTPYAQSAEKLAVYRKILYRGEHLV